MVSHWNVLICVEIGENFQTAMVFILYTFEVQVIATEADENFSAGVNVFFLFLCVIQKKVSFRLSVNTSVFTFTHPAVIV